MLPLSLVGAGWPVARKFGAARVRLGRGRPTHVRVRRGLGLGLVLAADSRGLSDPRRTELWQPLGLPVTEVQTFEKMMSNLITPAGAVLVGVTAGVSEELLYRGLLQPRFGLLAAHLLFTATHAFQYGFDGLLSVFIVGLVLGVVR